MDYKQNLLFRDHNIVPCRLGYIEEIEQEFFQEISELFDQIAKSNTLTIDQICKFVKILEKKLNFISIYKIDCDRLIGSMIMNGIVEKIINSLSVKHISQFENVLRLISLLFQITSKFINIFSNYSKELFDCLGISDFSDFLCLKIVINIYNQSISINDEELFTLCLLNSKNEELITEYLIVIGCPNVIIAEKYILVSESFSSSSIVRCGNTIISIAHSYSSVNHSLFNSNIFHVIITLPLSQYSLLVFEFSMCFSNDSMFRQSINHFLAFERLMYMAESTNDEEVELFLSFLTVFFDEYQNDIENSEELIVLAISSLSDSTIKLKESAVLFIRRLFEIIYPNEMMLHIIIDSSDILEESFDSTTQKAYLDIVEKLISIFGIREDFVQLLDAIEILFLNSPNSSINEKCKSIFQSLNFTPSLRQTS